MVAQTRSWGSGTALAGILLLGWIACGGADETPPAAAPAAPPAAPEAAAPVEPAPPAEAPASQPTAPAEPAAGGESAASADGGSIDLPRDVPLYPGAEVAEVATDTPGNQSAMFLTRDAPDRVADHFFAELRQNDWVVQQNRAEDGQALFAEKDSRSLAVMVRDRGSDGSEISIILLDVEQALDE